MSRSQFLAWLAGLIVVAACTSIPSPTPIASTTPAPLATASAIPTPSPTPERWRVVVVNTGPRRVAVVITTIRGFTVGGMVEPNSDVLLVDLPNSTTGVVQLYTDQCAFLQRTPFEARNFTVTLSGAATGPYRMALHAGLPLAGAPPLDPAAVASCQLFI